MNPIPQIITANGEYQLPPVQAGRSCLVQICDALDLDGNGAKTTTFGGATVTPGYLDLDGRFTPYLDETGASMPTLVRRGYSVRAPLSGVVCVAVAGAGAETQIRCALANAVTMPPGS